MDLSTPQLLLCDDSLVERTMFLQIMKKLGFHGVSASSGAQAISMIQDSSFDVIFLDLVMPEMDGWELARILTKGDDPIGVPLIGISSVTNAFDIEKAKMCGMEEVLAKPFNINTIQEMVTKYMPAKEAHTG